MASDKDQKEDQRVRLRFKKNQRSMQEEMKGDTATYPPRRTAAISFPQGMLGRRCQTSILFALQTMSFKLGRGETMSYIDGCKSKTPDEEANE